MNALDEPNDDAKSWMLQRIAAFLKDGGGSFRCFIDAINMDYASAYGAGGMDVSNALVTDDEMDAEEKELSALREREARLKAMEDALREIVDRAPKRPTVVAVHLGSFKAGDEMPDPRTIYDPRDMAQIAAAALLTPEARAALGGSK